MNHQRSTLIRYSGDSTLWTEQRKKLAATQLWKIAGNYQHKVHGAMVALELNFQRNFLVTLGIFTTDGQIQLSTAIHNKADLAINNACQDLRSCFEQPQLCPA